MAPRKGSVPHNKGKRKQPEQPTLQQPQQLHVVPPTTPAICLPAADAGAEVSLSALQQVEEKKKQLYVQLKHVERQIFDLETRYLQGCNPQANALIGYEGLLNQQGSTKASKTSPVAPNDRIFSSSSISTGISAGGAAGPGSATAAAALMAGGTC
eukprot:gene4358-4611_t